MSNSRHTREVRHFVNHLARVAASAPAPIRQEVKRAVHGIRVRYGTSDEEKRRAVIESVENGAMKIEEIHEDTGLRIKTLEELLPQMVRDGLLLVEQRTAWTRRGRPSNHYSLVQA